MMTETLSPNTEIAEAGFFAPDNNFNGYDFWLNKMNQFSLAGENVRDDAVALARVKRADMVKSFLVSSEYRGRFGL